MSAKEKKSLPADSVALYDALVATNPEIERKGVGMPYTSLNGNMFTFLSESGTLALRLPKKEREIFIEEHGTGLMEAHGTVMKEYVAVPDTLFRKTDDLKKYFDMSYEYAKTLKPKPTKR